MKKRTSAASTWRMRPGANQGLELGQQVLITLDQAKYFWSSNKEHKADALALGAEEGRDKLR